MKFHNTSFKKTLLMTLLTAAVATTANATPQAAADQFPYNDERFADLQMLRYQVPGFNELSLRQKTLVYCLNQAALYGRDILWDQNGRYNLRIRQMLETVYTNYKGNRNTPDWEAFVTYLKRVWFSNGIHHHYGCDKFQPGFSQEFLRAAVKSVPQSQLPITAANGSNPAAVDALCDELFPIMFDPTIMPKRVNQADGQDLILTSAENYYGQGVTQAEAEACYRKTANSKRKYGEAEDSMAPPSTRLYIGLRKPCLWPRAKHRRKSSTNSSKCIRPATSRPLTSTPSFG